MQIRLLFEVFGLRFINKQLKGGCFRLTVYQAEEAHAVRNLHKHSLSTELYRRNNCKKRLAYFVLNLQIGGSVSACEMCPFSVQYSASAVEKNNLCIKIARLIPGLAF